jgi:D-alanine-D-alanine ligase
MGGISRERDVSIQSGKCVAEALKKAGVNVVTSDIKPDAMGILDDETIDVFFIALHGRFGEDGVLQEILESKGLTYTGSPPQASRLAFDKWASKKRFAAAGIATPRAILFESDANISELEDGVRQLGKKYVIKPLREGSTIGISIVDQPQAAIAAAKSCAAEFGDCMIEEFIAGREITVGILGNEALPIIEIRPRAGFYDYHAKYIDDETEYLFDTIEDPTFAAQIQKSAIDCFNSLGCRGAARDDFIIGGDGEPYVLEINTVPGMTNHSLLPKAACKMGLSVSQLCMRMVDMALADSHRDFKPQRSQSTQRNF